MLELEENLRALEELLKKLNSLEEALNISDLKKELEKLQKISSESRFLGKYKKIKWSFFKNKKYREKIK